MLTDIEIIDKNGEFMEEKSCSAAEILLNLGVRQWVIIHHSKGAMALSKRGQFIYQSGVHVPSKEIKGTVGAGDAFAAGVLAGIHEDLSMQECLLSGVSVAASSLLDMTSTESVMLWSECLKLGMA